MFTCVWQLCGWVDPTRMENKKGIFQSQHNNLPQNNESSKIETFVKHPHNQNSTDHVQRNVQYSLKQPNYLIQQINPNFHNLQYENQYKVYQTPENFKGINVAQSFHVQNYTQYEKNAQSQVHRTTHVPPQSSLANNIIVQNTPQIWVPQQPITIPYQPQPAQKPEYQKVSSPSTPQNQGKSNTDKKKAVGSSQLKSPSAKRPPEAPVTKQGWLHKQGSEGLMLWKKRWFVLVEYCLFYYKGPEEEKLLGSILLPSYKVSIRKPEEKISKKYAFKCEHANMRTYILATDSQEQMMHWVTVLNLATLMQKNSELPKPSCGYNIIYESGDQQYPKNSLNPPTTINTHSPSNSLLQDQCAYNQPLYANAPPKPKRLNDGFSSPSPDILDRQNVQYIERRSLSRSPNSSYCKNLSYNSKHSRESLNEFQRIHDVERRTPETYGRSSNRPTDYEDIYAEETMYKRPLSPVAYNHVIKRNNPPTAYPPHRYTPVNMIGPAEMMQYPVPQMRKNPSINIARPHSADFLEYELNHKLEDCVNIQQRPRPKSSLEINSNDNDFYSRERYAEKMRKSVQYLKHVPPKYAPNEAPICTGYENVSPFVAAHSHFLNVNKSQMSHIQKPQPMRSKSALSEGKGVCGSSSETRYLEREMINPDFSKQYYGGGSRYRNQEFDQFTRSASARLAHQGERISVDSTMINRDGERKREESMRRLLEWKQRMLQSPLNRKIQGNVAYRGKTDIYNNNEMGYKISKHPKYNEAYMDDFHSKSSTQYNSYSSDDEASGSISINPRDSSQLSTFPRAISAQKAWTPSNLPMESHSVTNLSRNCEKEFSSPNQRVYYSNQSSSHPNLTPARKENWPINEKVSVSAGELLGRTHEELVLLLIQLRRQSSQTLQAIENCYNEFDMIQAQLYAMDQTRRMENLQKLEQIKQHLLELEKQYEKGKPLVNLVDNMVKLGSLYRVPQERNNVSHHIIKDRIEFNQQIQERRLLADEKREWNRLNTTNHFQLQEKVQQLYMLDRLIHEESGTLQNLQQDKEDIERALGGLRHRLSKGFKDPSEIELARKQQIMLENELIRVHFMLAQNSKKLEETVSGNAKLEQELMVLKQKLQRATLQTSSQYLPNPGDSLTCTVGNSPELESDLHKVKKNIGELQQQRHKLSLQVRQLTDRSSNTSQTKCPPPNDNSNNNSMINKKRIQSLWRETDLDTMSITDHGEYDCNFSHRIKSTPLYINTNYRHEDYDFYQDNNSTGDNSVMSSNTPQEKQEIKTVRIVKRESEKRQRDREKCLPTGKWDAVQEENASSDNCNIFKPPPPPPPPPSHVVHHSTPSLVSSSEDINGLLINNSVSNPNLCDFEEKQDANLCTISSEKSHDITPVFKSEAARQIITEMAIQQPPKQSNRRVVPKEKRRHYTAPHDQSILQSMQQLPTDIDSFDKHGVNSRRARDDLDMERALRQRIDAPDVVRSTLINTELKYNERTIDDLLGTPSKINIPERYIPEQLPQLSVEEQEYRLRKVESIKKMLSDTTFISTSSTNLNAEGQETDKTPTKVVNKATSIYDEKKQREHLLQLNQILAKQVMEMSKIVAEKATARLSNQRDQTSAEEDDLSPLTPLPLYQQRDNFYT